MDLGLWVIALLPPVSAIALCALLEFINKPTPQERKDRNAELIKARRAKINHNQQMKAGSK